MNFSRIVHEELKRTPFLPLVSQNSWEVIITSENETEGECSRLGKTRNYFCFLLGEYEGELQWRPVCRRRENITMDLIKEPDLFLEN